MPIEPRTKVLRTRVFEVAEQRGLRQDWLAARYGISPATLSRIKAGDQPISRKFIEKSCEIFELPLSALFFVEDVRRLTALAK